MSDTPTTPAKILVVEDENIVALDLRASLESLGYEATDTVGTGRDALESAERERPDLVMMDIHIRGDMDGIQTAEQMRRRFNVPIVYLTAFSDTATIQRARETEPFGYLLKPFEERELHIVIEMALFRHRAQRDREALLQEQAARTALEKQHRWTKFLAEASAQLSASLDITLTMQAVTKLAVPKLADWVAVHMKEGDAVETVAVHHTGGKGEMVWDLLRRYPPSLTGAHGYPNVLRTGEPELLLPATIDEILSELPVDAETRELLRGLNFRGELCVPLVVRGDVIGALTLVTSQPDRRFTKDDLDHAMELARRCAHAIDNARLYHMAQDAVSVRDEFLTVAAHELRSPLAALLLSVQALERAPRPLDEVKVQERVAALHRQLRGLADLVERLLDTSRLRAGELDITIANMDLAQLVREVTDRFRPNAQRAGCSLSVEAPAALVGPWDRLRLDQVLTNLLGNAVKFAAGTPIEVSVTGDDASVELRVRDRGIGISAERLPHIFDRFERGVSARSYGGLGLGLYVARRIVEAHGGTIEAESDREEGASFLVRLPRWSQGPTV